MIKYVTGGTQRDRNVSLVSHPGAAIDAILAAVAAIDE